MNRSESAFSNNNIIVIVTSISIFHNQIQHKMISVISERSDQAFELQIDVVITIKREHLSFSMSNLRKNIDSVSILSNVTKYWCGETYCISEVSSELVTRCQLILNSAVTSVPITVAYLNVFIHENAFKSKCSLFVDSPFPRSNSTCKWRATSGVPIRNDVDRERK